MNPSIPRQRIHSPYMGAASPGRLMPAPAVDANHETKPVCDAVSLGADLASCASPCPAVLQSTGLRVGVAVALGLSMWGSLSPCMAAPPLANPTPSSQTAVTTRTTPALPSTTSSTTTQTHQSATLNQHMREVKAQIDLCITDPSPFINLLEGFGQKDEGNCSAIASIKSAMQHYGTHALAHIEASPEGYQVTTRDGFRTSISFEELELTEKMEQFKEKNDRDYAYATLCYATMAKSALAHHVKNNDTHKTAETFQEALTALASGQTILDDAQWLGTRAELQPLDLITFAYDGHDGLMATSKTHAVFIASKTPHGHIYMTDHYGTAKYYDGSDSNVHRLIGVWGYVEQDPAASAEVSTATPSTQTPASVRTNDGEHGR